MCIEKIILHLFEDYLTKSVSYCLQNLSVFYVFNCFLSCKLDIYAVFVHLLLLNLHLSLSKERKKDIGQRENEGTLN